MTTTPDISPDQARPKRAVAHAYLLFFVSLFLVLTVGAAVQMTSLTIGLLLTEVFLILLPALVYVRRKRLPLAEALRWRPVAPGIALRCVVLGGLAWGMAMTVYFAARMPVEAVFGPDLTAQFLSRALPGTFSGFVLYLIVGTAVAGFCEETLFRGAIQGTLEKKGVWKAVLLTALLFAAYHMNPWIFFPAVALGVLFGLVTVRTNSVLPAMICHACNNLLALTFDFAYRHEPEHQPYLLASVLALLFPLALWEFLRHTRGGERQPSPLVAAPAGLSRQFKLVAAAGTAALVILVLVAARALLGFYHMRSDHLAPEVKRGDRVVVLNSRYIDVDIDAGDIVAFKREGSTFLRKVVRTDTQSIWVSEKSPQGQASETPIPRRAVVGKMIYKLPVRK